MSFFTFPPRSWPFSQQSNFEGQIPYPKTGNDFNQNFVPRQSPPPGPFTGSITGQLLKVTNSTDANTFTVQIGEVTVNQIPVSSLYNGYTILNSVFELTPGTAYQAYVTAINQTATTGCSNDPLSFTTADANLPGSFTFSMVDQVISSSGSNDATSYNVTVNGNTLNTISLNGYSVSNDLFGLIPPNEYLAYVTAINVNGQTPSTSNPVLFTASNSSGPVQPGFDVFLVIGQSNGVAYGNAATIIGPTNILQWGTNESPANTVNTFQYLNEPVQGGQPSITNDSYYGSGQGGYSWCYPFAVQYAQNSLRSTRQVLLVNTAIGGTSMDLWFYNGTNYTIPTSNSTGDEYIKNLCSRAVQYANNAMAYHSGSQTNILCGILHLGHEYSTGYGSSYLEAGKTRMEYATGLYNIINYLRNNITGASASTPFVSGMFKSDWVTSCDALMPTNGGNYVNMLPVNGHANVLDLQTNVHEFVQNYIRYSYFADNTLAMQQSGAGNAGLIHYGSAQLLVYGAAYYAAYLQAINNVNPVTPIVYSSVPAAPTISAVNNNSTAPYLTWTTVPHAYEYIVTGNGNSISVGTPYLLNGTDYPSNYFIQSAGYLQFTSGTASFSVQAVNQYGSSASSNIVSLTYGASGSPPGSFTATITTQTLIATAASNVVTYSVTINSLTDNNILPSVINGSGYTIVNTRFSLTPSTSYTASVSAVNTHGSTNCTSNPITFTSAGSTPTYFFDTYPAVSGGFQQGWSLRKLSSTSTKAIRISLGGSTSQDVGFNSDGSLNVTGLTLPSYPVVRWYNQQPPGQQTAPADILPNEETASTDLIFYPNVGGLPFVLTNTTTLSFFNVVTGSEPILSAPGYWHFVSSYSSGYYIMSTSLPGEAGLTIYMVAPTCNVAEDNTHNSYANIGSSGNPQSAPTAYFGQMETTAGTFYANTVSSTFQPGYMTNYFTGGYPSYFCNSSGSGGTGNWVGNIQELIFISGSDQNSTFTAMRTNVLNAWQITNTVDLPRQIKTKTKIEIQEQEDEPSTMVTRLFGSRKKAKK